MGPPATARLFWRRCVRTIRGMPLKRIPEVALAAEALVSLFQILITLTRRVFGKAGVDLLRALGC